MTERTFMPWVEQISKELRDGRHEVRRTAQKFLPEMWTMPSPLEGWTYKDLLAHLASGDWVFQWMLRGALGQETFDLMERGFEYVNEGNKQRILERRERSIEELMDEVASEGQKTQELLSQMTEAVDVTKEIGKRPDGSPITPELWIKGFPAHDKTHGVQLKSALDNVMM